ncbi:hypothetical protein GQ53DRAFT_872312 [Thozetella sp. PMI_491]|nr:hypothetical protein GQ53DRAFT_872312 [Thozetella sp. PMI_491]
MPNLPSWLPTCSPWTYGNCLPSGSALDALVTSVLATPSLSILHYHSPGLVCPANWVTAGVAVKASNGTVSSSGAFSPPLATLTGTAIHHVVEPILNVLMNAIDPGETAVVCCPSNWTADPLHGCYSTLPSSVYSPTGGFPAITGTIISTIFTTFEHLEVSEYVGVSTLPMVTMVHQASDKEGNSASTSSSPSTSNPANMLRPVGEGFSSLWLTLCVMVVLMMGLGVIAPLAR